MWKLIITLLLLGVLGGGVWADDDDDDAIMTDTPDAVPSLVGVTWEWRHFADGQQAYALDDPVFTITFADDGTFQAAADCNIVYGEYDHDEAGHTIDIRAQINVLDRCPSGLLSDDFLRYLSVVAVYSFMDDGTLLLEAPADSGTLQLVAQPQITGTVTYLQRIALPDDAVVRVQLQDVSIADAPTKIISEYVLTTEGAQVPFPFVISYPESAIEEKRVYSVSARITDSRGKLWFITDTFVPVITDDNPTQDLELILVGVGR